MPNLVGIWRPASSCEEIAAVIAKQLQRVRVPGIAYTEHSLVRPGFGMALMDHGLLENGRQPVHDEPGGISLLLDGELYNAGELKRRFRDRLPADLTTPELCLRLIRQEGEDVVRTFNGLFCIVMYDQAQRRLTFISDRYSFRPLFYKAASQEVIFGSELKAVSAADQAPRQIDEVGTAELFTYCSHFQENTWIQGYSHLGPATILTADPGGIRARTYWTYKYDEAAPRLDQETYFTNFGVLLDRAAERAMQGSKRIGIFLSGGYDSRSVAASIRNQHLPIAAFSFGEAESRDVRFGTMLAQRLGLEHSALTDRGPYLYANCRAIVWRTEGMLPFAWTTSIRYHALMKSKMDVLLTGFLAEFSGSHTWPSLLLARSRAAAKKAIYEHFLVEGFKPARRIFNPEFARRILEAMRARFEKSFERIENYHPFDIADTWNFMHIQPRKTYQAPCLDRYLFEMRAPHMDTELVDFLLTIPPYARLEQRVYKKMIAYCFPKIRDVPCTNSGLPINPHFGTEYASMIAKYAGRKASAPLQRLFRPSASLGRDMRDLNDDFRAEPELVDKILRPLLRAGIYPEGIFSRHAIEELIEEQFQRNGQNETTLSLLIAWGLAAKFFLHDDLADVPAQMYRP